jgi:hypothetical protein
MESRMSVLVHAQNIIVPVRQVQLLSLDLDSDSASRMADEETDQDQRRYQRDKLYTDMHGMYHNQTDMDNCEYHVNHLMSMVVNW